MTASLDPVHTDPKARPPRRGLLRNGLFAFLAGLLGRGASAVATEPESSPSELVTEGPVLRANVSRGRPPVEPLDTMIRFERSDNSTGRAITHEVLSLMHEEKGPRSFPWTIYAHLDTRHVEGDACVLCSRLHKRDAGWSSGLHSEIFNTGRGVGLGVNVELTNEYPGPEQSEMIGVNVQALGPRPCRYGMQIHGKGRVEKGIGLNGEGDVGLDVAGRYGAGVNVHDNSIVLNEGASIVLDGVGKIRLRYRQGRIEFLNGDRCVGHIRMDGEDHEL